MLNCYAQLHVVKIHVNHEYLPQNSEVGGSGGGGPIRNKRYISLRVKLLKRQFGLPSDVLSLKSLSLGKTDANENTSGCGKAEGLVAPQV